MQAAGNVVIGVIPGTGKQQQILSAAWQMLGLTITEKEGPDPSPSKSMEQIANFS